MATRRKNGAKTAEQKTEEAINLEPAGTHDAALDDTVTDVEPEPETVEPSVKTFGQSTLFVSYWIEKKGSKSVGRKWLEGAATIANEQEILQLEEVIRQQDNADYVAIISWQRIGS